MSARTGFEQEILDLLPGLRRFSRSLSRSDTDGEDLLQDCLERALARRTEWRGVNLRGWLLTIMSNLSRSGHRRRLRRPAISIEDIADAEPAAPAMDGDPLMRRKLETALATLGAEYRTVLMLVVVEGYSYEEVAAIEQIPLGTVMSRLSRARAKLREVLSGDNVLSLRRPK